MPLLLLRRPAGKIFEDEAFRSGYELTRVHGFDVGKMSAEEISNRKVYSDAILADFAAGRHATHAVLTVYRPYPYLTGRPNLLSIPYAQMESEIRREVLAGFGARMRERSVRRRLRESVAEAARRTVVDPVRAELEAFAAFRRALAVLRG